MIGHLWAELGFWFFPEKRWKYSRPRTFGQGANILAGRAGTTAGTVRQRSRPYKVGGLRADPHLRTAWRRDNITWTRALQPDWEGVRSWRFCRAQIVRVWAPIFWAHTSFIRREDFNGRLVTVVYYEALFGTWLGMMRITWGKSPEWLYRNLRFSKRATIGVLQPMLPGETQVWSESSVDERNLYSTRSAIIGLAVETWRVKTELIIITILHIIIITTSILNLGFKTIAPRVLAHTNA